MDSRESCKPAGMRYGLLMSIDSPRGGAPGRPGLPLRSVIFISGMFFAFIFDGAMSTPKSSDLCGSLASSMRCRLMNLRCRKMHTTSAQVMGILRLSVSAPAHLLSLSHYLHSTQHDRQCLRVAAVGGLGAYCRLVARLAGTRRHRAVWSRRPSDQCSCHKMHRFLAIVDELLEGVVLRASEVQVAR